MTSTIQNSKGPVPVLFWVHGGGFVGGDKSGVKEFATKLVSDANIAVVAMNYELAPDSEYPNQVLQVNELIKDLLAEEKDDKLLDMEQLFLVEIVQVHKSHCNMQLYKRMMRMLNK